MADKPSSSTMSVADPAKSQRLRANFGYMALVFSIGHAVVVIPINLASSLLDAQVGYVGNGVFHVFVLGSAIGLGPGACERLGPVRALALGMGLYAAYVLGTAFASTFCAEFGPEDGCLAATPMQWIVYLVATVSGGLGAGFMWLAQSALFALTVDAVAAAEGVTGSEITAELASRFAVVFLAMEVLARLSATGLLELGVGVFATLFLYSIVGFGAAVGASMVENVPQRSRDAKWVHLNAVVALWSDPKIWLLSLTNMAFGFSAAFVNGYVNAAFAVPAVGTEAVSALSALTVVSAGFVAACSGSSSARRLLFVVSGACAVFIAFAAAVNEVAISAAVAGPVTIGESVQQVGDVASGQPKVIVAEGVIIASCESCVSFDVSVTSGVFTKRKGVTVAGRERGVVHDVLPTPRTPSAWGWGLSLLYLAQGVIRGVFESSNRALHAELFPGESTAGALGNNLVHTTVAFALAYFLSELLTPVLPWIVGVLGALSVPATIVARGMVKDAAMDSGEVEESQTLIIKDTSA
mmetsp:Transcript_75291/g.201087  ORF Transcript_75291/g.201087 Transcript_75291/m.201087 type:complete len:525 (-) Transcript_75291:156-1730(-)